MLFREFDCYYSNDVITQVKLRNDMPDDMLYDAIKTTERVLKNVTDFELEGFLCIIFYSKLYFTNNLI